MTDEIRLPPNSYTVWTLTDAGAKSSQLGGSPDLVAATTVACTLAQVFRVGVGVYDSSDVLTSYISRPHETEPASG